MFQSPPTSMGLSPEAASLASLQKALAQLCHGTRQACLEAKTIGKPWKKPWKNGGLPLVNKKVWKIAIYHFYS